MPNGDISSVKFFRSYHDAAKLMCDAERLAFYDQLLAYVFDGAEPEEPTSQFVLVEPTLSRSLEVERHNNARRANGQRGGRPKKEAGPAKEDEPEDDGEFAAQAAEIVAYLNERAGRSFRAGSKATQRLIHARMAEGFEVADFRKVIDVKCASWLGDAKFDAYLRPSTLFGTKFEAYLNERPQRKTMDYGDEGGFLNE